MDATPALPRAKLDQLRRWPVDPRVLTGLLPTFAFWLGYREQGASLAIVLGLGATLLVFILNRHNGTIGALALMGLVVAAGAAAVGLVAGSERVFLAREPASDFISVGIAAGTLAYGRSLGALVLRELFPSMERSLPERHSVFVAVTLIWAGANLAQGVIRAALLWGGVSVGEYLVASRGVSWVTNGLMFLAIYLVLARTIQRIRLTEAPTFTE